MYAGLLGAWVHVFLRVALPPPGNPTSRDASAWQMRGAGAHNRASNLRMHRRAVAFQKKYIELTLIHLAYILTIVAHVTQFFESYVTMAPCRTIHPFTHTGVMAASHQCAYSAF